MLLRLLTKAVETIKTVSGQVDSMVTVRVKFEPMDANGEELYKFESTVVGGAIRRNISAVGEGIEEAMKASMLSGLSGCWYPALM